MTSLAVEDGLFNPGVGISKGFGCMGRAWGGGVLWEILVGFPGLLKS